MMRVRGWIFKVDWRIWAGISIAVAFTGLIALIIGNYQSNQIKDDISHRAQHRDAQISSLNTKLDDSKTDINTLKQALDAQIAQFNHCKNKTTKESGCSKAIAPTPTKLVPGPKGDTGPQPSLAQLLIVAKQAVLEFCSDDRCKGEAGSTPSASQLTSLIQQALLQYCQAHNDCLGSQGIKGDKGDKGDSGGPGPVCPEGYQAEPTTVITSDGPVDSVICRASPPV